MTGELKQALIIFARRPAAGRVKTRLSPPLSPDEAAELYRRMLLDILAKAATLPDLDKWVYFEPDEDASRFFADVASGMHCAPQRGNDLGARMANAFSELFSIGYGRVAIIGTDLPDLPPGYVEEAFRLLADRRTDVVFGPSEDGGYYLLGMRELHGGLFRGIRWSSAGVLRESLQKADEAGITVSLLPPWHDVDTADDLRRPQLLDEKNGAPLTRAFIGNWLGKTRKEAP